MPADSLVEAAQTGDTAQQRLEHECGALRAGVHLKIGLILAASMASEICDINRFATCEHLTATPAPRRACTAAATIPSTAGCAPTSITI